MFLFIYLSFRFFFFFLLFLSKRRLYFLCCLLCIVKKTPVLESLFNKVAGLKTCIFIKIETPIQVCSCEYCEIFRESFFCRTSHVHYTFQKFFVILEFFERVRVQNTKLRFFIFFRHYSFSQ